MAIEFYAAATTQFVDINNDAPMAFKAHKKGKFQIRMQKNGNTRIIDI